MREPITVEVLVEQLKKLRIAHPTHAGTKTPAAVIETAEVYREGLHGLSADALRAAVRLSIETEKFFPKVADLRGLALDWTRRNAVDVTPVFQNENTANLLWCRNCQTEARYVVRYRPAVDRDTGAPIFSQDGVWVQLETYERLLCPCASPCAFEPEPEVEGLWMLRERIAAPFGRSTPAATRAPVRFMTDEARAALARDPHAPEHIGERAENYATGVLEHA